MFEDDWHDVKDKKTSEKKIKTLNDELNDLEEIKNKMEIDIKSLWEIIVVPYFNNINNSHFLNGLRTNHFDRFYNFFLENNPDCIYVLDRIQYINHLISKNY